MTSSIVVLNGGSSSGKSSIARALQELLPDVWLTFETDTFVEALPGGGDSPHAGIRYEPDGRITLLPVFRAREDAWYAGLKAIALAGAPMILDEILLSGGAGQDRLRRALGRPDLVWVGVHCDPDVAALRESRRPDRQTGMARQQAVSVHAGMAYDLELDTTHRSAMECANDIASLLR